MWLLSFVVFSSIKLGNGYQTGRGISSDIHSPILYRAHVFLLMRALEIKQWVNYNT